MSNRSAHREEALACWAIGQAVPKKQRAGKAFIIEEGATRPPDRPARGHERHRTTPI